MTAAHDFTERLAYSEQSSDETFWQCFYRQAFPNYLNSMPASGDTESQRRGIDRVILLTNGELVRIDEKKRERTWNDFLLEYISVDRTGAPGWIEKELAIDYLAYAFMDTRKVYLLDWKSLRRAWQCYGDTWKLRYPTRKARNYNYTTLSVAVPIPVVLSAMSEYIQVES